MQTSKILTVVLVLASLTWGGCTTDPQDFSTAKGINHDAQDSDLDDDSDPKDYGRLNGSPADESVDLKAPWIAIAADRINNRAFSQTGPTRQDAIDSALHLCNVRAGLDAQPTCVFVRAFRVATLPRYVGEPIGSRFVCFATESNNPTAMKSRSWLGIAQKEPAARQAALDKCSEKGGIDCRITQCSTADGNKISL